LISPFLALFTSLLALAPLDASTSSPDLGSSLQQLANEFSSGAAQLLQVIDGTVIDVTRVAYITVLLLGILLYFTRVQRRLGRELITGGIILAVLSEFVFPLVFKA
jgi:type IV secretory pathway VirB2 component (pilin)